eukprot:scaffold4442_cov125-Amphora_coffeaeformis.AAC.10
MVKTRSKTKLMEDNAVGFRPLVAKKIDADLEADKQHTKRDSDAQQERTKRARYAEKVKLQQEKDNAKLLHAYTPKKAKAKYESPEPSDEEALPQTFGNSLPSEALEPLTPKEFAALVENEISMARRASKKAAVASKVAKTEYSDDEEAPMARRTSKKTAVASKVAKTEYSDDEESVGYCTEMDQDSDEEEEKDHDSDEEDSVVEIAPKLKSRRRRSKPAAKPPLKTELEKAMESLTPKDVWKLFRHFEDALIKANEASMKAEEERIKAEEERMKEVKHYAIVHSSYIKLLEKLMTPQKAKAESPGSETFSSDEEVPMAYRRVGKKAAAASKVAKDKYSSDEEAPMAYRRVGKKAAAASKVATKKYSSEKEAPMAYRRVAKKATAASKKEYSDSEEEEKESVNTIKAAPKFAKKPAKHPTPPKYGKKDPPQNAMQDAAKDTTASPANAIKKYAAPAKVVADYTTAVPANAITKYAAPAKVVADYTTAAPANALTKEETSDGEFSDAVFADKEVQDAGKKAALECLAGHKEKDIDHWPIVFVHSIGEKLGCTDYEFRHIKSALKWRRKNYLDSRK